MAERSMHEPLSATLKNVLTESGAREHLTLDDLLQKTSGRGIYLFILILCLPFVLPVSIPGMSTPFGLAIIAITAGLLRGGGTRLPARLARHHISPRIQSALLRGGVRFLQWIERFSRPRRTFWMSWRVVVRGNALLLMFMALLLALPLPPVPPFTNMLPSYAIIFIAISMMEEDGILVWIAYAASLGTSLYFGWWAKEIWEHVAKWSHLLLSSCCAR